MNFKPDEPADAITLGKALGQAIPMLRDAAAQVIGDSNVERAIATACENINGVVSSMGLGRVVGTRTDYYRHVGYDCRVRIKRGIRQYLRK